ncbi:ATP-binding cassette domain-containing protein [Streptomyces sp. NPDC088923]|uniref:ATP-binding cassette domain-containing protein n=1 Tax=Streptomyces sp. NPDC088923 TaxID=3365913 RepID=UPI003801D31E
MCASLATARALGLDPDALRRRPHALSGGQLQRAALVRALGARPALLVADESTAGLDPVTARRVLDVLAEAAERYGTAVLLVSHTLGRDRARRPGRSPWPVGASLRTRALPSRLRERRPGPGQRLRRVPEPNDPVRVPLGTRPHAEDLPRKVRREHVEDGSGGREAAAVEDGEPVAAGTPPTRAATSRPPTCAPRPPAR